MLSFPNLTDTSVNKRYNFQITSTLANWQWHSLLLNYKRAWQGTWNGWVKLMVLCKDVDSETSWKQLLFYPATRKTIYISKKNSLSLAQTSLIGKQVLCGDHLPTLLWNPLWTQTMVLMACCLHISLPILLSERDSPGGTAPTMEFEAKDAEWNVIPTCFLIRAAAQIHKRREREWGVSEKILCFLHEKVVHWSKTFS